LQEIFNTTGLDLSDLPSVATTADLAVVLRTTTAALAQDRHRKKGCPYSSCRWAASRAASSSSSVATVLSVLAMANGYGGPICHRIILG